MSQTLFEKLQLKDEKNILIQGLPSTIEKQFAKISFAKSVTPLLKSRKIDFALVFAINQRQLNEILKEVMPALHDNAKLWIAYPKLTSKVVSDLNRDCTWDYLCKNGYSNVDEVVLDYVWSALHFVKPSAECDQIEELHLEDVEEYSTSMVVERKARISPPAELEQLFTTNKKAREFFDTLPVSNKKEYVGWINTARKEETRATRLGFTIEKLSAGKLSPSEK